MKTFAYSEDYAFKVYYNKKTGEANLTKIDGTTDEYIIDAKGKRFHKKKIKLFLIYHNPPLDYAFHVMSCHNWRLCFIQ